VEKYLKNKALSIPFIFFCGYLLLCFGIFSDTSYALLFRLLWIFAGAGIFIIVMVAFHKRDFWWFPITKSLERHTDNIDKLSNKHIAKWIMLASALGLYMELLIIRWHSSCFGIFAHFKNVSLISCFLGLGIGYAIGRKRPLTTPLFLPALSIQIICMHLLQSFLVQYSFGNPISEQFAHGLTNFIMPAQKAVLYGFIIIVFAFNTLCFIPMGQLPSRLMIRRSNLIAYSWNLLGSLLGITVFSVISFFWSPPSIWLFIGASGVLLFLYKPRITVFLSGSCVAIALLVLLTPITPGVINLFSPYQIISLHSNINKPPTILVNHAYHQRIFDLSTESQLKNEAIRNIAQYYELPYLFKPSPERVLIVGSGTGNDVAAALRSDAKHVDAVEIDPAILYLGKELHPEKPYQNSRTTAIVNDARSFIRQTDNRYDIIAYGLLDSHTVHSGMSNIRLDSFVYTVEAFREARSKLKDDGIISMSFSLFSEKHGRKLFQMLSEAFDGKEAKVYSSRYDYAYTFVIGPGMDKFPNATQLPFDEVTSRFDDKRILVDASTDDWPFFYMPVRAYPVSYVIVILLLIAVSILSIRQIVPGSWSGFSIPCFFLGAGFMLIETKTITELGLAFGNTWMVISVVISGILIMAFLANMTILRLGAPPLYLTYGLLVVFLVAGMSFSKVDLTFIPFGIGKILITILLTGPLFFSGLAFSYELRQHTQIPVAISSNLMGAILGGFLEYNSMYFGFRSLYIFALVMYGISYLGSYRLSQEV